MLCEKYKDALMEAAVNGDELAPPTRSHVESCSNCTADLAQQRLLAAAMDTNLHQRMNAPVPAAVLQRLEAHLAQQPQPKRASRFAQIFAGALATLAVAGLILIFLSRWKIETFDPNATPAAAAQNSNVGQIQVHIGPPSDSTTVPTLRAQAFERTHSRTVLASAAPTRTQPEILVPPDEQIALDRFVARGNTRREFVMALATPVHQGVEPSFKDLQIPDINTAEIIIQPIATEARR